MRLCGWGDQQGAATPKAYTRAPSVLSFPNQTHAHHVEDGRPPRAGRPGLPQEAPEHQLRNGPRIRLEQGQLHEPRLLQRQRRDGPRGRLGGGGGRALLGDAIDPLAAASAAGEVTVAVGGGD